MKEERLSTEHFEAVKQLAEMGSQLSTMRSEIIALKADKEAFLSLREQEAHERVEQVLVESVETLDAIGRHHEELKIYANAIATYAEDIKKFHQEVTFSSIDLRERLERADKALNSKRDALAVTLREVEIARKNLAEDRKQLAIREDAAKDERRRLKDERETLTKAWAELEAKKKS